MVTPKLPTVQVRDYKNDGNQYYYPEDVTSVDQKSFVYFETYNEPAITLNGVFNDILQPLLQVAKKAGEAGFANTGGSFVAGAVEPFLPTGTVEDINESLKNADVVIPQLTGTGQRAVLYLPISTAYTDTMQYENATLGFQGAIANKALASGSKSVGGALVGMIKGGVGTLYQGLMGGAGDVGSVITQMAIKKSKLGGKDLEIAAELAQRVRTNPNARVMFSGVGFREFTFTFKLIASSRKEAENIEGMIKWLRKNMYPDDITTGANGVSIGYKYPPRFKIMLMHKEFGKDAKEIFHKIKPAYLKSCGTVYNATQQSFHPSENNYDKAKPFEVDLTLSFQESRQLVSQDIEAGF
jgi:hypothetical protein